MRFALAVLAVSSATVIPVTLPEPLRAPPCVACRETADAARDSFTDADWRRILAGEVVTSGTPEKTSTASDTGLVRVAGLVPQPPSGVWAVLADFPSRPDWVPSTKEVRIVRVDGDRVWLDERLRFFLVNVAFRMVNTLDPEHGAMRFELDETVPHDIGASRGSWELRPLDDARQTIVVYRARIDTGRRVPAFVQKFLLEHSLPQVVIKLRDEVGRRARAR